MYYCNGRPASATGLGFSLKPPKVLRNFVSGLLNIATKAQTTVDAAKNAATGGSPSNPDVTFTVPGQVPSWALPAAAAGAILLMMSMKGRRSHG